VSLFDSFLGTLGRVVARARARALRRWRSASLRRKREEKREAAEGAFEPKWRTFAVHLKEGKEKEEESGSKGKEEEEKLKDTSVAAIR
jgi:hypothetical protein